MHHDYSTPTITKEEWRPVLGYEGIYEVSNLGRVRSLDRIDCIGHRRTGIVLKDARDGWGYRCIRLCKDAVSTTRTVHQLVAEAFIGPKPQGHDVHHRNETKSDNRADNLEYIDGRDHISNHSRYGKSGTAKLTVKDVIDIKTMLANGITQSNIAKKYGMDQSSISNINTGKRWGYLEDNHETA